MGLERNARAEQKESEMPKVYVSFMIDPEDKKRMEEIATRKAQPGEDPNISLEYRKAIRLYLKLNEEE